MKSKLLLFSIAGLSLISCKDQAFTPEHEITVTCHIAGFKPLDHFTYSDYTSEGINYNGQYDLFSPWLTANAQDYGNLEGDPGTRSNPTGGIETTDIGYQPCRQDLGSKNNSKGFYIEVFNSEGDRVLDKDYSTANFNNAEEFDNGDPFTPILKFSVKDHNPQFRIVLSFRSQTVRKYFDQIDEAFEPADYYHEWEGSVSDNPGANTVYEVDVPELIHIWGSKECR